MFIYALLTAFSATILFYLLCLLLQNARQKADLAQRLARTVIQAGAAENDSLPDNKSQLTDILSQKITGLVARIVPQNIIANIEKNLVAADIKNFDISKYFLLKVLADSFILIFLPFYFMVLHIQLNVGLLALLAIGGFFLPDLLVKSAIGKRHNKITKALPTFIDLLRLCIEAGLDLESSFGRLVKEDTSILQPEAARLFNELKMGEPLSEALRRMSARLAHPDFSSFATILLQANEMGMSIAAVLRTQEEQITLKYIQGLRARAAKTPVLITLPLVGLILPALFLLVLGPAVLQLMQAFSGGGLM
ncbi:MAG: type II secretion system F family protein [Candidatus Margulisbacteria bacterium]|jgi:tight adherence protein C|nr:type II secretion system F family protein [Candidatus Margulisiibacteriota bacterium]